MAASSSGSYELPSADSLSSISPQKIAVVGIGNLGIRIAGELALCGCTVRVHDHNPLSLQTVHSRIADQLRELAENGLLPPKFDLQGSVIVETVLSNAVSDVDIVVEAVVDSIEVKRSIFQERTTLCSSSLNLSLDDVFQSVPSPGRSMGLRFLYPVYLIDRVEMTPHHSTSTDTTERVTLFLEGLGKSVFQRSGTPVILTVQEALQLQREHSLVEGQEIHLAL